MAERNKLTESQLNKQARDVFRLVEKMYEYVFYRNHQTLGMEKGRPDWEGIIDGQFLAIELKVKNNKLSKDQEKQRERIMKAGGLWFTCYSIEEVVAALQRFNIKNIEIAA